MPSYIRKVVRTVRSAGFDVACVTDQIASFSTCLRLVLLDDAGRFPVWRRCLQGGSEVACPPHGSISSTCRTLPIQKSCIASVLGVPRLPGEPLINVAEPRSVAELSLLHIQKITSPLCSSSKPSNLSFFARRASFFFCSGSWRFSSL